MVTAPGINAPVIPATSKNAPTWAVICYTDCQDMLNVLGNCYDKKGHMARDCKGPEKNKGCDNPMETEKITKIVQEMMVK